MNIITTIHIEITFVFFSNQKYGIYFYLKSIYSLNSYFINSVLLVVNVKLLKERELSF